MLIVTIEKVKQENKMKKISQLTIALVIMLSFVVTTVRVNAQAIEVDEDPSTSQLEADTTVEETATTEEETKDAGVPETGFAPQQNKVLASSLVFVGGAAIGGALGFGIVQLRRKNQAQ